MKLYFATGNTGKVEDVQAILQDLDITVKQVSVDAIEPQEASLEEIVTYKVQQAVEQSDVDGLVMADDSGLFLPALNGFPGILSSPFEAQVGKEKLLRLLDDDRRAAFRAAVAVHDPKTDEIALFNGSVDGELVEPRGEHGFGYDPMFQPKGHDKTFAEDVEYKHQVSHRREVLDQLRTWLEERED